MAAPDGSTIQGNGSSKFELEFIQEAEVVDGKVVRTSIDYDMQEMMRQLGLD